MRDLFYSIESWVYGVLIAGLLWAVAQGVV
jgi:hypothetical protein